MSVEENKAIVKRYHEGLNKGNVSITNELVSPDFVRHGAKGAVTRDFKNLKELQEKISKVERGILITDDMIAEGDRIAWWGTLKSEGKADRHLCFIIRFSGGKIVEDWNMIRMQSGSFGYLPHE